MLRRIGGVADGVVGMDDFLRLVKRQLDVSSRILGR